MKLGKNTKNKLKIKEGGEILYKKIFKKEEISWKEWTLTPL